MVDITECSTPTFNHKGAWAFTTWQITSVKKQECTHTRPGWQYLGNLILKMTSSPISADL